MDKLKLGQTKRTKDEMVSFFLAIRIADKEQAMKLRDVEVEAVLLLPAETQVHIPPSGDFFNFLMD